MIFRSSGTGTGMGKTHSHNLGTGTDEKKSIPKTREWEGNEKIYFQNWGKGMKKIHPHNLGTGIRGYHTQKYPGTGMKKNII